MCQFAKWQNVSAVPAISNLTFESIAVLSAIVKVAEGQGASVLVHIVDEEVPLSSLHLEFLASEENRLGEAAYRLNRDLDRLV